MRPISPLGRLFEKAPGVAAVPALVHTPVPGPPSTSRQSERCFSYIAAYSVSGSFAVDHQVDGAGAVVDVEDLFPGLAPPSLRTEHAALFVAREQVPHRRHPDGVRIGGVHDDAG